MSYLFIKKQYNYNKHRCAIQERKNGVYTVSFKVTSLKDALDGYENVFYTQGYKTKDETPDEKLIEEAAALTEKCDKSEKYAKSVYI